MRFTPSGGHVDIDIYREDGEAVLKIVDTGPGIAAADLDRIFEPFFRGSQPSGDGTGLGLSIVQRIVERLHGSVVLDNKSGGGETGLRATVRLRAGD
jgi:two-component system OmpR family sensor kinase